MQNELTNDSKGSMESSDSLCDPFARQANSGRPSSWNWLLTGLALMAMTSCGLALAGPLMATVQGAGKQQQQGTLVPIPQRGGQFQQEGGPPPNRLQQPDVDRFRGEQVLPPEILEELFRGMNSDFRRQMRVNGEQPRSVDRERSVERFERIHRSELRKYEGILDGPHRSIVRVEQEQQQVALGTIVSTDGYLVTKASELYADIPIVCHLADGSQYEAEPVLLQDDFDLVLLKIEADSLTPVEWGESPYAIGTMVAVGNETGNAVAAGVISVEPRALIFANQAVLGVVPQPAEEGVLVSEVAPNSAAQRAGLRANDIALAIDGEPVATVPGFTNRIRRYQPGETITLSILRGGREMEIEAALGGRNYYNPFSQGMDSGNFVVESSGRRSEFPIVLQHDAHLWPEQCGGPLIDLDGKAVGINIARGDRVSSFAIPGEEAKTVIEEMVRQAKS